MCVAYAILLGSVLIFCLNKAIEFCAYVTETMCDGLSHRVEEVEKKVEEIEGEIGRMK